MEVDLTNEMINEFLPQEGYMSLENKAFDNLNVFSTKKLKERRQVVYETKDIIQNDSVFSLLNCNKTKMGERTLAANLCRPLTNLQLISTRLDLTEIFKVNLDFTNAVRTSLYSIGDLQAISTKLRKSAESLDKRSFSVDNCVSLLEHLKQTIHLYNTLKDYEGLHQAVFEAELLFPLKDALEGNFKLIELLSKTIKFDKRTREHTIDPRFDADLKAIMKGKEHYITVLEGLAEELKNLAETNRDVTFEENKGIYVFEINKADGEKILAKQTRFKLFSAKKASRLFSCDESREVSIKLKMFNSQFKEGEAKYIKKIVDTIVSFYPKLVQTYTLIGKIDFFCSLGVVANQSQMGYSRPIFTEDRQISIKYGHHPLLENSLATKTLSASSYVPNDTYMSKESFVHIISGINMGGKSTYLRQVALIIYLAQTGSFAPCFEVKMPIFDNIFTRIGAGDSPLLGYSTFMDEMRDMANMVEKMTPNSFLIIDELGRGTSSSDGIALSWEIAEEICRKNVFCLMATHFSELTELEKMQGIANFYFDYDIENEHLKMKYQIKQGISDKKLNLRKLLEAIEMPSEYIELPFFN